MPYSGENKYILLSVDVHSGFIFAKSYPSLNTECAIDFISVVFIVYGIPNSIMTDFSKIFDNHKFEGFLASFFVKHDKITPGRSKENGMIERNILEFRLLSEKISMDAQPKDSSHWTKILNLCTICYNNSILRPSSGNYLTRNQLHFSSLFNGNNIFKSAFTENDQKICGDYLNKARNKERAKYKNFKNPFEIGQLCQLIKTKSDLHSKNGGTACQPRHAEIFRILGVNDTNVRVLDLNSGSQRTIDIQKIRFLEPSEISANFGAFKNMHSKGSFIENRYIKKNGPPIFDREYLLPGEAINILTDDSDNEDPTLNLDQDFDPSLDPDQDADQDLQSPEQTFNDPMSLDGLQEDHDEADVGIFDRALKITNFNDVPQIKDIKRPQKTQFSDHSRPKKSSKRRNFDSSTSDLNPSPLTSNMYDKLRLNLRDRSKNNRYNLRNAEVNSISNKTVNFNDEVKIGEFLPSSFKAHISYYQKLKDEFQVHHLRYKTLKLTDSNKCLSCLKEH